MRGDVTDAGQPNDEQLNIELLSQWKLEAEFRKNESESDTYWIMHESHFSCDTTGLLRTSKLRPSPFFKLL